MKPKRAITMRVQIKPYPLAEHIPCIPQRSYCTIFCILIKTCVIILRLSLVHSVDNNSNKEELSCHLHYSNNFPSTALSVAEQIYYLIITFCNPKVNVMLCSRSQHPNSHSDQIIPAPLIKNQNENLQTFSILLRVL